jgi:hypothetical protein
VTPAYLLEHARLDHDSFGAPVWLLAAVRGAVHLIGNVLKDRVVNADAHGAEDLGRLLARGHVDPLELASALSEVGLARGGAVVTQWLLQHATDESRSAIEALAQALTDRGWSADAAHEQLAALEQGVHDNPLLARLRARTLGDRPSDRLLAAGATALAVGALPLRRWLLQREAAR